MASNEIPTVAQRMSGASPAKGTGVTKKSIRDKLFNRPMQQGQARSRQQANTIPYRVPGQPAQPLTAPVGTNKPLGSPQQGQAPSPLVNNDDPYFYNPIAKPDYSKINPNDPAEIEYQRIMKAKEAAGKAGKGVTMEHNSTPERTRIGEEYSAKEAERQKKFLEARKADPEGYEKWLDIKFPGRLKDRGFDMRLPENTGPAPYWFPNRILKGDEKLTNIRMPGLPEGWEKAGPDDKPGSLRDLAAKANWYWENANAQTNMAEASAAISAYEKAANRAQYKNMTDAEFERMIAPRERQLTQAEFEAAHRAKGGKFAMGLSGTMIPVIGEESNSPELNAFKQKHKDAGGKFAPAYPGGPMIPVADDNTISPSEKAINDKHAAGGGKFATTPGGKMIPISGTANNERSQSLIDAENAHRAKGGQFAPDSQGRMIPVITHDPNVPVGPYVPTPPEKFIDTNKPKTYAKTPMDAPVNSYNYV